MAVDKVELRALVSADLGTALDAIAMARGMTRTDYVIQVLEAEAKRVAHEATVIVRAMRGNPLLPDSSGVTKDNKE